MRIDRAAFFALALGAGFTVTACGTTRQAQVEPSEEGFVGENEHGFNTEPAAECIGWDETQECVAWENPEGGSDFVGE